MLDSFGIGKRNLLNRIITEHYEAQSPEQQTFNYNDLIFLLQEMTEQEGKKYFEGDAHSPHRGFIMFRRFVELLFYRNVANFDSMVLLTGDKGVGKSSVALVIAREWCKYIGVPFTPEKYFAYSNNAVLQKIHELPPFSPIVCDESVKFAQAAEWAKKEHKQLKMRLAQVRTKHMLYILCFPLKVEKVEKNYLESYTNYWIQVIGRGVGTVFVKDQNPSMDGWRIRDFKDIGSYNEFTPVSEIRDKLKKHPNFWQLIKFPRPPERLYMRYLKLREKNVYDDDNVLMHVTKEDIYNACLILALKDILTHDPSLSVAKLMKYIKAEYDITMPKSQVLNCVEDAKQLIMKVRESAMEDVALGDHISGATHTDEYVKQAVANVP